MFGFEGMALRVILDSSMVEHAAVNRGVVGSSPTRGAKYRRRCLKESAGSISQEVQPGEIKQESCGAGTKVPQRYLGRKRNPD